MVDSVTYLASITDTGHRFHCLQQVRRWPYIMTSRLRRVLAAGVEDVPTPNSQRFDGHGCRGPYRHANW